MNIQNKFKLKQTVFLITDPDQYARIITAICIRENGVTYELCCGPITSWHYEFEMILEKSLI